MVYINSAVILAFVSVIYETHEFMASIHFHWRYDVSVYQMSTDINVSDVGLG